MNPLAVARGDTHSLRMSPNGIIVLVPTCGRANHLERLLASLGGSQVPVRRVYVTDNCGDFATKAAANRSGLPISFETKTLPRGPGATQRAGWLRAQQDSDWTHALLIDDDAEVLPNSLGSLLAGLVSMHAALAVPLLVGADDRIGWFPGVTDRRAWRALKTGRHTPATFRKEVGSGPFPFRWAPWGCVLVTRQALMQAGPPSADYGFEVEDIDYVLRLLCCGSGILVPEAVVRHLQAFRVEDAARAHLRRCLAVQNIAFLASRHSHGRSVRRYVPGHVWRLLCGGGWRRAALADAVRALWLGAVRGRAGGMDGGDHFLRALFEGRESE